MHQIHNKKNKNTKSYFCLVYVRKTVHTMCNSSMYSVRRRISVGFSEKRDIIYIKVFSVLDCNFKSQSGSGDPKKFQYKIFQKQGEKIKKKTH